MSTATIPTKEKEAMEAQALDPLHSLSVYVSNKPGVLSRIAQAFARRGFNIESLVVSPAANGKFSRMTIGVRGDPERLGQIIAHVGKLVDTLRCVDHTEDNAVTRELALVKVRCGEEQRLGVLQIVEHFGCKTVDLTETSLIIMATGDSDKVDAFVRMIGKYEVIELVRTGKVVMARGDVET